MNDKNPYETLPAEISAVIQESPNIKTFVLKPAGPFAFQTGQFIELTLPGVGEAPFTPSSSQYETDFLEVTVMKAGFLTSRLHQAQKGDTLGIRGPYGASYPLDKFKNKDILILGGGVGLAPLRSLLLTMLHDIDDYRHVTVCFGAKTPGDFIYKDGCRSWMENEKLSFFRSVDRVPPGEPWTEKVCLVTGLLNEVDYDPLTAVAVVCGPPIMMKYATQNLLHLGYREENVYLSMEKKMYCGFGQCRHCMIGRHYVCKDGPVFTYARIKDEENIWE
ncbi:MAG: FAD/NAD(P)-binding protein [Bacillota bacterium]